MCGQVADWAWSSAWQGCGCSLDGGEVFEKAWTRPVAPNAWPRSGIPGPGAVGVRESHDSNPCAAFPFPSPHPRSQQSPSHAHPLKCPMDAGGCASSRSRGVWRRCATPPAWALHLWMWSSRWQTTFSKVGWGPTCGAGGCGLFTEPLHDTQRDRWRREPAGTRCRGREAGGLQSSDGVLFPFFPTLGLVL